MAYFVRADQNDFEARLEQILDQRKLAVLTNVRTIVEDIIAKVRLNGDAALLELTQKYDGLKLNAPGDMIVSARQMERALSDANPKVVKALSASYARIYDHHQRQLPKNELYNDRLGVTLGWRWSAIKEVGIYVPGGLASYPSTVLMNAIPARIAGVERLAMVVPGANGQIDPLVLVSAKMCGIEEIYTIGGAQAIAALAFGTDTIPRVDKVVGPGNRYVVEAKRQVFGQIGIDSVAGPSEVLVIADNSCDPDVVAGDILAQCEHDRAAQGLVITDCERFAGQIAAKIDQQLEQMTRNNIANASWRNYGAIIIVDDLVKQAGAIADRIAAEHVEILTERPEEILDTINNGGAFFLGRFTPEAIGDYVAGTNHVLPTFGAARFSSGLSVADFMKRSSILSCDQKSFTKLACTAETIAQAEGLEGHGHSIAIRQKYLSKS